MNSTAGAAFDSTPSHVLLPPDTTRSVTVKGKAKECGVLIIRGCFLQLPGTAKREAILPLLNQADKVKHLRRLSVASSTNERIKRNGLNAWLRIFHDPSASRPSDAPALPELSFAELRVVPEQPHLRIRRTSLTHGAVMLYEGETYVCLKLAPSS